MKKLFIGLTVIVSVICCVCFSVSADDATNITFFDFDEYAKYSYDSATDLITADIQLPSSWRWSYVKDGDGFTEWHNTFNFTTTLVHTPVSIDYNPFAKASYTNTINHGYIQEGHFLDLQYIPSGASLNIKLVTQLGGRNFASQYADLFIAYVDSTGKVISHSIESTSLDILQMGRDGIQLTVTCSYSFDSVPSDAKGFYYLIRCSTGLYSDSVIPVTTVTSSLVFNYSEQNYNIKQNQIIRDKVSNIDKQIGDLINKPVEPEAPEGQEDFDDLHNNEQELLSQSQIYLNDSLIWFDNAGDVIFSLANGFQAISVLCRPVFALPFANSLISVSISLGVIATLIGVFIQAISNGKSEKESGKAGKKSGQGGKSISKGGKN